jgi:hypothetical protein
MGVQDENGAGQTRPVARWPLSGGLPLILAHRRSSGVHSRQYRGVHAPEPPPLGNQ